MPNDTLKLDAEKLRKLLNLNFDARQYFFSQADERWLDWLWKNGFLDIIKEKAEDPTKYGYKTPELGYLIKVAEKEPLRVTNIILSVPISEDNFNPEVIDRFLHICSILPAEQLGRLVIKIRNEKWVTLMGGFNSWGFEYGKMLKTLSEARDYKNILILLEAILSIKSKEELNKSSAYGFEHPFYFNDLSHIDFFGYLANVSSEYAEQALKLSVKIMTDLILLTSKEEEPNKKVFEVYGRFFLLDVDFFTLRLNQKDRLSGRDNVRELAAVIKELAQKTIGMYDADPFKAKTLYDDYIKPLPDCRSMWRLKLFVLTSYPEFFKEELKESFFRLFTTDHYYEIISGTEYEKALQKGFVVLSEEDKRAYIEKVLEYFKKKDEEKDNEKQNWHLRHGSEILSMIVEHLTNEEKQKAQGYGFTIDPNYKPEPSIGPMRAGTVVPRGPITEEEFNKLSIAEISKNLRDEWTPKKLSEQNKGDDFLRPLNAEGVADLLRKDIRKRMQDYINNAPLFFERNILDQHYTYSFLRGIQEILRNPENINTTDIDWSILINLLLNIKESGTSKQFKGNQERDSFDAWLAGWNAVHSASADVIQELLKKENSFSLVDFQKNRNKLFGVLSYLLSYPNPTPDDEKRETAKIKVKSLDDAEYSMSDPFTTAINTVRGRAFQTFVSFVYLDSKTFEKEENPKISKDIKDLYEKILDKEKTLSIRFLFGHYIPTFYFKDISWMHSLLPKIFPVGEKNLDIYLSAWEGYLSNNLFSEIFSDPEFVSLYSRAITLSPEQYTKRKYHRELDEGLATHLALAFMYFENFSFDHKLYQSFWGTKVTKRQAGFVSFIGRHYVSGDDKRSSTSLNKEQIIERLKKFWDWALKNCDDPEALAEFGYWMNNEKMLFEYKWLAEHILKTLEKTKGSIEWEYGLMKSLVKLAEEAPNDTVKILRLYLLNLTGSRSGSRGWIYLESEMFDAFKVLYADASSKNATHNLINELLPLANGQFWKLKEVVN